MIYLKDFLKVFIIFAFISLSVTTFTYSAENNSEGINKDLNDYLCKDVMRMSGENRSVSLGVLHGYMMGINGTTKFNHEKLLKVTDNFVENCLDNPNSKALDVFKKTYNAEMKKKG